MAAPFHLRRMIPRRALLSALAIAAICVHTPTFAQERTVFQTNFLADGTVVEIDFSAAQNGSPFLIFWNAENLQYNNLAFARTGRHSYEMRNIGPWHGQVDAVGITAQATSARVKIPHLYDELDMLFERDFIKPNTINLAPTHLIFGMHWEILLFLVGVVSALAFSIVGKQTVVVSAVFGFLISWGLMDLCATANRVLLVSTTPGSGADIYPFKDLKIFSDQASKIIGTATWSHEPVDGLASAYLRYRLAQYRYVPWGSTTVPDYWITQNPNQGRVVWRYAQYGLVKSQP